MKLVIDQKYRVLKEDASLTGWENTPSGVSSIRKMLKVNEEIRFVEWTVSTPWHSDGGPPEHLFETKEGFRGTFRPKRNGHPLVETRPQIGYLELISQ